MTSAHFPRVAGTASGPHARNGAKRLLSTRPAAGVRTFAIVSLAARTRLHRFVRTVLSQAELIDVLILAAAALVVLPFAAGRL